MRRVLAFDTATDVVAIGIGEWPDAAESAAPRVLAELDYTAHRAANTRLLPSVLELLAEAGLEPGGLDAIVVGRGPGSFTGVRIAVATAKGVAQGLGVPLHGVGTLDAIASRFERHDGLVAVAVDAMRQEVYPALFRCGGGRVERLSADRVTTPDQAAAAWATTTSAPLLLAGSALAKHADVFAEELGSRATFAAPSEWGPSGSSLLAAAFEALPSAGPGHPDDVLPVYTRLADAEEAEARRLGRASALGENGVAGPGGERT